MKNLKMKLKVERTKPDWKALLGWLVLALLIWWLSR